MSADWKHHVVTVEVIHDEPHVKFACSAPEDGVCRTYPKTAHGPDWVGCECEAWFECDESHDEDSECGRTDDDPTHDQNGHVYEPGQECWVTSWFQAGDGNAVYTGPDGDESRDDCVPAVARTGPVDISFVEGEYVEWVWYYPFQGGAS
jgi:hypothetical protein